MDSHEALDYLNSEEAKQYVGGVVFVSIIMVIGIVGNVHVLLVYSLFMKPSNHRIFILVLGVLDFITCIVGMPFILVDLRHPLTFTLVAPCKILRFINYFICSSSALMLIVIATDRYRKICVPLGRQISQTFAKILCLVVMCIALLMSWPAPVLYGVATVPTSDPNINGTRCYTENRPNFDKLQGYFNAGLVLIVLISFVVLVVLYCLIWRVIAKHGSVKTSGYKEHSKETSSNIHTTESQEMTSGTQDSSNDHAPEISQHTTVTETKSIASEFSSKIVSNKSSNAGKYEMRNKTDKPQPETKKLDRSKRTTLMFLIITAVFFLSYVPHLALKIAAFMKKRFVEDMSFEGKVAYNTFVWCFFMNNAANCFIYGFVDLRFRAEIVRMYGKLKLRIMSLFNLLFSK